MAELKTRKNDASVEAFLNGVADDQRRADSFTVLEMMKRITGEKPKMWGPSIVGFGDFRYRYASGREGDWFVTGFSPRKQALTLYVVTGFERRPELMGKLGKHTTGKSCLYIKKLDDVDVPTLESLIEESVQHVRETGAAC